MKFCSNCKVLKSFQSYSKNKSASDGYQNTCKACQLEAEKRKGKVSKQEAADFMEKLLTNGDIFQCKCCGKSKLANGFYSIRRHGKVGLATNKCKSCQRDYQRKKSFPSVDYNVLLKLQSGKCAICGIAEADYKASQGKAFAIDHDHKTGAIRGLLCCRCNRGLGYFGDNVENLTNAINYLQR